MTIQVRPLRRPLLLGLGVIILCGVIVGLLGLLIGNAASSEVHAAFDRSGRASNGLLELESAAAQVAAAAHRRAFYASRITTGTTREEFEGAIRAEFDRAAADLDKATKAISRLPDDAISSGRARESIVTDASDVGARADELMRFAEGDGDFTFLHTTSQEIARAKQSLHETISTALANLKGELTAARARAGAWISIGYGALATALACSIILAFFLSDLILRSTRKGVTALADAIGRIAAGTNQATIEVVGESDLCRLGAVVNDLDVRMKKLRSEHAARVQQLHEELDVRKDREAQLRHDAMHDPLTGLSNRHLLIAHLNQCIERADRSPNHRFALLFLDLDRFKMINDSLGHNVGDELLKQAAARLVESVRGVDSVVRIEDETTARLGGDEFAILLDGISNPGRAILVAERIQRLLSEPFRIGPHELTVNTSIGIALGNTATRSADDILRDADTAMYRAKLAGGSQHAIFDDEMHAEARRRLEIENDLRKAVEQQHFEVRYQPIVRLDTGRIIAFEALIRWVHPERGIISPSDFIPMAEETGLIVPIGRWALRTACRQLCEWHKRLGDDQDLSISVNVSPRQVTGADIVGDIRDALRDMRLDARHLRVEITESMLMEDDQSVLNVLHQMKAMGLQLYLDDFGTGYSSLSCLHRFPIDVLKIDREFVNNMNRDRQYSAVIRAIMMLAHSLDMKVTAEGLETPEQLALVKSLDCEYGQGFLFAEPLRPGEAWELLSQGLDNVGDRKVA